MVAALQVEAAELGMLCEQSSTKVIQGKVMDKNEPPRLQIARLEAQIELAQVEIEVLKTQPCGTCGGTVQRAAYSRSWVRCTCLDSAPSSAASETSNAASSAI